MRVRIGCHPIEGNPALRRAVRGEPWWGSVLPHSGGPLLDRLGTARSAMVTAGVAGRSGAVRRRAIMRPTVVPTAPRTASAAPVAAIERAAAVGSSSTSRKASGGHHSSARRGAGTVQSCGSETMPLRYPPRAALTRLGDDLSMTSQ